MDRVCGNSHAVIDQLAEERVPRERLRLIYNGIQTRDVLPNDNSRTKRAELGIGDDALVLVVVANLIPYKGHADLIDALGLIKSELPQPWVLLVLGRDDGIGDSLKQHAQNVGVADDIHWLGSRRDVAAILNAADIGILCSHQEGFSNAVLEGMAAGLPMIVTDVGGNVEAVEDGLNGRVVPPREPRRLAEVLLEIARSPNKRLMGEAGRHRVQGAFSLDACVDAYEALYRELTVTPR
jgi:glycosyltransferase involved in cell wall biosynthesis